ncbi:hypothetical protein [Xanthobacter agilis]|uniref:hypothetical protein n=1 Tax=Xanthobacter agilis TaxID=47492 RepID=UPI00372CC4F8
MLDIDQLGGLWRRSLIVQPDGRRDTTTEVYWLQGPEHYIDLRQPADRPSFAGVRALRDLTAPQIGWLARQDGFAGRLVKAGAFFEWQRHLDFQPPSALADAGRLWLEDGIMKEEGRDVPYLEHWHRAEGDRTPAAAFILRDARSGGAGSLVVVGDRFMLARARPFAVPGGRSLADLVAEAPTLSHAQDLVDCEISFGTVGDGEWLIRVSSLPFREGCALGVSRTGGGQLATLDTGPAGGTLTRRWSILHGEGAPLDIWLRQDLAAHAT